MIEVRVIDQAHAEDIRLPNEPFLLSGRMAVSYTDGQWQYEALYAGPGEADWQTFPDEHYDYETMKDSSVFVGAYEGEQCVGLAVLQPGFFRYMYLYDLKVNKAFRGRQTGRMLIDRCREIALAQGYLGLYTQGQDNNLGACLFYLHTGFYIGGFDSNVYKGTKQDGKADIIFYLDG